MLIFKKKKNEKSKCKGNRLLISVTVLGSTGPFRFVVNEEETVGAVIATTLKLYAREGRLPRIGPAAQLDNFILYCWVAEIGALSPFEKIESFGARNFVLYKKPVEEPVVPRKGTEIWKTWFRKSRNLRISYH